MTENSKYVRFDWAIKRILRDKANKEVLEGLITVLIGEPIKITDILESEGNQDSREDKTNRVDVKAKTERGEYIIVEVQLTKEKDFFQRILFGTAKNITDQISIGMDYKVIRKIYSVNILYFDFGSGDDYAYHGVTTFTGMTKKDAVLLFNNAKEERFMAVQAPVRPVAGLSSVTPPDDVFPEYFLLIVNKFDEIARTPIEEWMRYLKDAEIREDTTAPGLQAAREKLAIMSMTEKERRAYEDYMISVHAARDAWETLKEEGRAEGWEEGRAEGREEGKKEAKAEAMREKMESARKLKATGLMTAEQIADVIGIAIEDVNSL
jgi:hypothetical protein